MITPRLYRRSLASAGQWQLLAVWWASLIVPGLLAWLPVSQFLSDQLDHSTRAKAAIPWMDGSMLMDLLRQLGEDGHADLIRAGLVSGGIALLFVSPFVAGAMVAAAHHDEELSLQRLLAGAGTLYGRMLRTLIVALIPLGIAFGLSAALMKAAQKANEKAIWSTAADRNTRLAMLAAAALIFVFHLLVDLTRAHFAADLTRRSALLALWSSVRVFVRRPLRVLGVGVVGSAAAFGPVLVLMALRMRIAQSGVVTIALAWLLAQAAQIAVGWGRGMRIFALAELVRADSLERSRTRAFTMEPPATSPPPPAVQSETLSALSPPQKAGPDLSTPEGSAT